MNFLAKATCGRNGKIYTFGYNGFATSSNPVYFSGSPSSSTGTPVVSTALPGTS